MSDKLIVKAVFSDVDGTLLNSVHRVTPRTGEWIHRILDKDSDHEEKRIRVRADLLQRSADHGP